MASEKKLFQPKFEHCTKNSSRKNFLFFKVLGIRSGWESEREILSGDEIGVEEREREVRQKNREREKFRKEAILV